ncbi:hypothetical protein V9T40_004693 [Parthenolecanium corni]|uniref:Uncharacterized protein n=1 Tax=Parthenolecanium corni TaxID=536013 RepID=A0AAN9TCS8_9HEMI
MACRKSYSVRCARFLQVAEGRQQYAIDAAEEMGTKNSTKLWHWDPKSWGWIRRAVTTLTKSSPLPIESGSETITHQTEPQNMAA